MIISGTQIKNAAHSFLAGLPVRGLFLNEWRTSLLFPNTAYAHFDSAFDDLPEMVKQHRLYFKAGKRGFGEDAFHVMWYYLFKRYDIDRFLEIGVYRGQTLSLAALLQKRLDRKQNVTGITPMTDSGDAVSHYADLDYETDIRSHFAFFELIGPRLVKAYSTDKDSVDVLRTEKFDCIYIDGSHDYETVRHDWHLCSGAVDAGGLIVLDDAGLYTGFRALKYGFRGHPGPSKTAAEIDPKRFRKILQVGHNLVFQKY